MISRAAVCALGLVLAACRHAPPEPAGTGASSFTFVERPAAPPPARTVTTEAVEQKPLEDYVAARPVLPLATPVYPARALAAKAGRAMVGVRLTVDATGRVSEVGPSILAFSTPGPWADDFRAAVESAVKQWRFRPAEIVRLEFVQSPTVSYSRIVGTQKVEAELDVAFTFTATGGVKIGK